MPSSLVVNCLDADSCKVYFEPWGSEYELLRGDRLNVLSDGQIEVSHFSSGIVLGFSVDDPAITNAEGEVISI